MLTTGLASVTFRSRSAGDVAALAADAGLDVVEWAADVHVRPGDLAGAGAVRETTVAHGLRVGTYGSYHKPGTSEPGEFDAVARTAAALGAPRVRVWAGTTASAQASPSHRTRIVDAVRRCADTAATHGVDLLVEHHVESLTDDLDSALDLHRAVAHSSLVRHWQPRELPDPVACLAEVRALRPATVHAFSWGADGFTERLPLGDRADVWAPVIEELTAQGGGAEVLLEFVPDDDPAALTRDARTLRGWVTGASLAGAR